MNFRDVELLSAYLDGQLNPADSAKLESRLDADKNLQAVMDDLRTTRSLLRQLPQRRAPRNFTLTSKMAGLKAPEPRVYPAFRLATVLAALLFIITFAVNGIAPFRATRLSAAQAPAYGLGGGGGGCDNCGASEAAPAATAAPPAPLQSKAAVAPTEARPSIQDNTLSAASPTPLLAPKAAAPFSANNRPAPISAEGPIPLFWQIFIGIVALICGVTAWLLRLRNEQEFHKRWNRK